MEFSFRLLDESDYDTLVDWWRFFRFPVPPRDYLPENGLGGLMVTKDGQDICAGFLFLNNSKIAWLEFIVRSNIYRENDVPEAIEYLIDKLCHIARARGYKAVFTSLKNESLIQRYEAAGFKKGSRSTTEMTILL